MEQWEQVFVLPCTVALSVSRLSALAHSRHWIGFTSFPRTGGALMKSSVGSGAVVLLPNGNSRAGQLLSGMGWLKGMLACPGTPGTWHNLFRRI